ncbi:hypothetical protein BST61_g82 [Cercospora zeina]
MANVGTKKLSQKLAASPNTSASSSSVVGTTPPEQLVDLPVEMQLRILSCLQTKEIRKCRGVSRHLRGMIDLKENQSLLFNPGSERSIDRLKAFIERYCEFPMESADGGPDAYLDAVFDLVSLRQLFVAPYIDALDVFNGFWLQRAIEHFDARDFFHGLRGEHLTNEIVDMWDYAKFGWPYRLAAVNHFNGVFDHAERMFPRVQEFLGSYDDRLIDEVPGWRLTTRKELSRDKDTSEGRFEEFAQLQRVLGLPLIPVASPYSYYTSSEEDRGEIADAMHTGEKIRGMERAALLEKISIY